MRSRILIYLVLLCLLLLRLWSAYLASGEVKEGEVYEANLYVERVVNNSGRQELSVGELTVWAPVYPKIGEGNTVLVLGTVYCPGEALKCSLRFVEASQVQILDENIRKSISTRLKEVFRAHLDKKQAQLLSGIVFGGNDLDRSFKRELAGIGLSHIVAASGMNVTLVAGPMVILLKRGRHRMMKALLASVVVWFYSSLTGFDPPIVRAAIMSTMVFIAQALGRGSSVWWSLGLSGYLILWVSPKSLSDFGFLLSYASMVGQLGLSSLNIKVPNAINFIAQSAFQSVASVIVTLPIILLISKQVSLVTVFTNILITWTVEPLMILGVFAVIVNLALSGVAGWILVPAEILLNYFLYIVTFFSGLSWKVVEVGNPGWLFMIGYYIFIFGVYIWIKEHLLLRRKD